MNQQPTMNVSFAAVNCPADTVCKIGGDFWDIFPLPGNRLGMMIGDYVGHDVEAAAHAQLCKIVVRLLMAQRRSPAEVLTEMNRFLLTRLPPESTATLFVGILSSDRGSLDYASAGHEPCLLFLTTGGKATLEPTGLLLGAAPGISFRQRQIFLEDGAILALFTDGLVEARECGRGNFLGPERFQQILRRHLGQCCSLEERAQQIYAEVQEFCGCRPPDDDRLLVLVGLPGNVHQRRQRNDSAGRSKTRTADHLAYFLAGHPVPAGIYREMETGRELCMEEESILPATCDGHVAVYTRQPVTWSELCRQNEERA